MSVKESFENANNILPLDIEKIKAEELFRYRFKKELQGEKKGKFWEFLNSSFGLFLFTAIFITGLGNFLSRQYQNKQEKVTLYKEGIKHLIEFDYRLSKIEAFLQRIDSVPKDAFGTSFYLTKVIESGNEEQFRPAIEDYQKVHMLGLIGWFKYNFKATNHSEEAYQTLMTIHRYSKDGYWDTKNMHIALIVLNRFKAEILEQLNDEIKKQNDSWF